MGDSPASVLATTALNPRLRRVTLRVDDPDALDIPPVPDAAVGVYFTTSATEQGRTYSVRRHDRDRLDLDVVVHTGGLGSNWAQTARAGDRVRIDHANGWYRPPSGTSWQLLITDLAGLPATARIMAEAPAAIETTVVVEAAELDDLEYLPERPGATVMSTLGTGNGLGPSRLAHLVRQLDAPTQGYCWFAGEAAEARQVRKDLRGRGWSADHYDITGYWRYGSEAWDTKFALVSGELGQVYQRAVTAGKGPKAAAEEFDEALERAGL
ncbi:siderophore-interacting protein [Mycobacterium sp. shizuoka-1]|uniref:siderophore-interacting protein n=1 Tax=Mycobacterium sp. shizuoka-1 TaxID=2039281 RepID=UPI000C06001E|nr:siderophore-interacting protein [Mycobacterium sp. shizuoka-1]GAY17553.1 siderophore-interacting protein [Mycobacterium sp. shizuoka-1]